MSYTQQSSGRVEKISEGAFEIIEVELELDDAARRALAADAAGEVRRFLEAQGYSVHKLSLGGREVRPRMRLLHVTDPPEYASAWHRLGDEL